jgi:succinate dehydrogenase / fumarate reductase flavoprotein subunit
VPRRRAGQVIDRAHGADPASTTSVLDKIMDRFDRLRNANGGTPTAVLRDKMQRIMQEDAAVFRTQESLARAASACRRSGASSRTSRSPTAR